MTTIILIMIAQQCNGDRNCIRYLESCTRHITSTWHSYKYPDPEDRAKFALSICEDEYRRNLETE